MEVSESLSCENNTSTLFSAVPDSSNMYSNKDSNLISVFSLYCSQEEEVSNGYVWGTSIQVLISQWYLEISSKTALEEMISDHYASQWSLRRPLARDSGSSKLCFQFLVISYLCSSKIYMSLKATLFLCLQ